MKLEEMNKDFENEWGVERYKQLLDDIIALSMDADGYGLFESITDEDVEKCKYICMMLDCLNDVPLRRIKHIFKEKNITEEDMEAFREKFYEE